MNCGTCIKVNPLPSCIDSDVFQLWGLTFPLYPSQTIIAMFIDTATDRPSYFELEIDPDGAIIDFDIASLFDLSDHIYEIRFNTQSSGAPATFTLTNEDDSTTSGCCVEFKVNVGLTGTGGFFLSNLGCAADEPTGGTNSLYMLKSVYDPDGDGCVECADEAQTIEGESLSDILNRSNHTGTQSQSTIVNLVSDLALKENKSEKGVANGYVPLNAGVTIDPIYLPISSPIDPPEEWNVITNTPTLADGGSFTAGQSFLVTISGNPTARNLGSGSQNWSDGDLAIYQVSNTFMRVPRSAAGVTSVTTALGVQLAAVTLNNTSYIDPSADRNYATDDQKDAMDNANAPDASNPFATQSDLTSIVVGSGFFMPETFSNGETLGNGIHRTLQSLGYSNLEAASIWPLVNSNFTIDVTQMDIDWIAWQEACLTMQHQQYSALITPGGRGYMPYDTILLPREQNVWTGNRRSLMFDFDFKGSAFRNTTGNSFICFDRYPVDQTEANGNFLDFMYTMSNGFFVGNDSADEDDCFIRMGASVGSMFRNIKFENCGIGIDAQFCLQVGFENIFSVAAGKYGIACRDGLWTGAGANTAQSNNATISKFHVYHGSGKSAYAGLYVQGNRNVCIYSSQFEGHQGAEHHIYYNQSYPTSGTLAGTVKNLIYMESIDFENAGASRAGIRVIGNNACAELNRYNSQVAPADMAVLCELQKYNAGSGDLTFFIRYANNHNPGYKFRDVRNGGGTNSYVVEYVMLNNNAALDNAANWDLTSGGSIPTRFNYTPII